MCIIDIDIFGDAFMFTVGIFGYDGLTNDTIHSLVVWPVLNDDNDPYGTFERAGKTPLPSTRHAGIMWFIHREN